MCGICGAVWNDPGEAPGEGRLEAMMDRIAHRGPDDAGIFRDDGVALGFRRLAIVDLEGARQPLANEDGSVRVVFNGEIYNFPELRRRLEARGHVLRSRGDTETLVHLYEDEGVGMFEHLRGMFALAIWDAKRRSLLLARDRMGQKPLLYRHHAAGRLTFASELKALLALPESEVPRQIDPVALDQFLAFGYVPHPRTILEGVNKLPPAHYAVWRDGRLDVHRYWSPDWNRERRRPFREDAEELRATLDAAVREQMIADVPLGAFLSGGVDSTIIVALMQRASSRPIKTFSIGFPDPAYDETAHAELAARAIGTEHHAFVVEPKAWETIPELARQFDEPFGDSSALPTWHVARETRREVTVALTGDAGDELFGGYDRYRALAITEILQRIPNRPRRMLAGAMSRLIPRSGKAKSGLRALERLVEGLDRPAATRYLGWMTAFDEVRRMPLYSEAQLERLADFASGLADPDSAAPPALQERAMAAASERDAATRAMVADLLTYLPGDLLHKVDMASMAHSLECRGPFLDHRVVELAAAMPVDRKLRLRPGRSKVVLKRAFADLIPASILTRRKMGFGVPVGRWFRGELKDELSGILLDPSSLDRGLFRPDGVREMVAEHVAGRREHGHRLWALLVLELWMREHLDPTRSRLPRSDD